MSEPSDSDAIQRVLNGDQEAFALLVRRHQRDVYRLAIRMTGRHEDADEVAQEAFVRAYRGLRRFRGSSSFKTWLYRIVVNLSINRRNKTRRERERTVPLEDVRTGIAPTAPREVLASQRQAKVRRAVSRLPARQRETLVLRLHKEMKFAEIAQVMNCSVGTAKANFFHAVVKLKKALAGQNDGLQSVYESDA